MSVPSAVPLRVVARARVARDVVAVELAPTGLAPLPSWSPGAHVDLHLPNGITRPYSLCGDVKAATWRIMVRRDNASRGGSIYLTDTLTEGDLLTASEPRNTFPLVSAAEHRFVAGGIGITAILPMIEQVERAGSPWSLLYGARSTPDLVLGPELEARYGERVRLSPQDRDGLITVETLWTGAGDDTATYVCGPGALVSAVAQAHACVGRGTLHLERFDAASGDANAGPVDTFEVEAARSGAVTTVTAGTSVLDALSAVGVAVPSSCTEGICGTCEVVVLAGEPDHRDHVLSEAERASNTTMLPCVSRARSARLVLDV